MEIESIVGKERVKANNSNQNLCIEYTLFCQQYLEKPVISGDYKMAITPTACTIKLIPVIDDF
ncbi:MAG: hypothetical protein V1663_03525 [archaeon]